MTATEKTIGIKWKKQIGLVRVSLLTEKISILNRVCYSKTMLLPVF